MGAHDFRCSFTPLTAVLFTFPSRYWFTIGRQEVFSLGRWSARIRAAFHVCRATQDTARGLAGFRPRGSHPLWRGVPAAWPSRRGPTPRSYQPPGASAGVWAVPLSLAATGGIAIRFLFLRLLRCFTSAGLAPRGLSGRAVGRHYSARVTPFGHPRIKARSPLPGAYRSLPRPSSPPGAKASIMRPIRSPPPRAGRPRRGPARAGAVPHNLSLPHHLTIAASARLSKNRAGAPPEGARRRETLPPPTGGAALGLTGLEPVTPRLSSACSDQLSYRPGLGAALEAAGLEPATPCLQSRRSATELCPL